ncbi:PAS domain S-box protein [uncultured Alsobacter sp.]|uniref:PAS domain S-box protein n=1 Tax=uncultured Alsobacter sp. TaxID=1748258 RepID=UPI0025EA8E17|nr:PAS domain S-box protein [uncultured Alsobacter sp.]
MVTRETPSPSAPDLAQENLRLREELRLSEGRLRALLDALPVGVIIADASGRLVLDNAANRALWGVPPETGSWENYGEWLGWDGETGRRMEAGDWAMARALLRGETTRNELIECQPFDGGPHRFYINNAAPIRDAAGAIVGGVVVELDVTERQAEDRQRQLLQQLVETIPDLVALADPDGRVTYMNRGGRRMLGVPEGEDVSAVDLPSCVAPEQRPRLETEVRPAIERTGTWTGEMRLLNRAAGTVVETHRTVVALRDRTGRQLGLATIARDVSLEKDKDRRLRELLATLDAGAFMTRRPDGTIRYWSDGCQRLYGWTAAEALGRKAQDLLHTTYPDTFARISARLEAEGEWEGDLRQIRRDGTAIVVRAVKRLRRSSPAGPNVLEALTDVTAQREAETQLALSQARLHTIVETVPVGLVMAELPSGQIVEGNSYVEKMLGHPVLHSPDIHSYGEWVAFHADGRKVESHEYPLARMVVAHEDNPVIEVQYQRGDGTLAWTRIMGRAVRDAGGHLIGGVVALIDIDAERRTLAALAESETRFRLATDAGQIGVFDFNIETDELTWDDRVRAMWGMEPGAPVTLQVCLDGIHPDDVPMVRDRFRWSLKQDDGADTGCEYRVRPRNGDPERRISAQWRTYHRDGRAIRLVGTVVDVTAARQAQAILTRDKADLERLVAERTKELEDAQQRLAHSQRMEALGQLAGGIAHDFNNVLHAVQGGALLLAKRAGDPDSVRRYARLIGEATERGAGVTRRLLAFSRRGDLRAEAVAVRALLDGMQEILSHTLGSGIRVDVEVEDGVPALFADKGQLETMLVNLATNARDAMDGSGVLRLAARRTDMRTNGHGEPVPVVCLKVIDTGEGMPPDVLARATEPFFTTKPRGKGTGLGLAMAKGFAEQSGGGLSIESAPGQGTTVATWFPVAGMDARETAAPADKTAASDGRGRRILLVDDDTIVRTVTAEQLGNAGYLVLQAERGVEALSMLDRGEPVDLLVSDLSMPGMDGIAVIREAQRRRRDLPAILLTGFATSATEPALAEALPGTYALLRKPISGPQLIERIEVLVNG